MTNECVDWLAFARLDLGPLGRLSDCVIVRLTAFLTWPCNDGYVGLFVPLTSSLIPGPVGTLPLLPFIIVDISLIEDGREIFTGLRP